MIKNIEYFPNLKEGLSITILFYQIAFYTIIHLNRCSLKDIYLICRCILDTFFQISMILVHFKEM